MAGESGEALVCARVVGRTGSQALRESRERTLERFLHVPAPGFAGGG